MGGQRRSGEVSGSVTRLVLGGGVAAALMLALYLPVCHLVFRCGCTWFFAGGSAHCNIHNVLPPHCPACSGLGPPLALGVLLFAGLFFLASAALRWLKHSKARGGD